MNETEIIEWIRRQFPNTSKNLKVGIGDDCSIIRSGNKESLFTCDTLIEGIHFKKEWGDFETWGKKIAGAALSDIAAMGGKPTYAWVELHLPKNFRKKEVRSFYRGLKNVFKKFKVALAGGNIARSPKGFAATVMIQGERSKGVKMLRSDAKPGDLVYLSGRVGETGLVPKPQIKLGQWLARNKIANACIDVSDGLLKDLDHIAKASGVKIIIEETKIPHTGPFKKAVTSGEDYILAFTAPPSKEKALRKIKSIHRIGVVLKGTSKVEILDANGRLLTLPRLGYEHRW